jgi:hypothetical protein
MSPTDVIVILAVVLLVAMGVTSGTWTRELQAISGSVTVKKTA